MIRHLHALRERLSDRAPVHIGGVEGEPGTVPVPPYLIAWSSAGEAGRDPSIGGACGSMSDMVGVTCVAGTEEGAIILATSVREDLTPGFGPGSITVPGRHVTLTHSQSRPVQVDRDVRITGTNTHPAYGVELFRLDSQPL